MGMHFSLWYFVNLSFHSLFFLVEMRGHFDEHTWLLINQNLCDLRLLEKKVSRKVARERDSLKVWMDWKFSQNFFPPQFPIENRRKSPRFLFKVKRDSMKILIIIKSVRRRALNGDWSFHRIIINSATWTYANLVIHEIVLIIVVY